jgi:hypothetical protein
MACCAAPRQSDDSQNFHGAAEARHGKGGPLINCAEDLRGLASGVAADQSGHLIDGFCGWCTSMAGEYVDQADEFFAMARVSEEVGRLLYGLSRGPRRNRPARTRRNPTHPAINAQIGCARGLEAASENSAAPSRPTMAIHLRTTETRITAALPPDAAVRRPVALIQAPNGPVDHTELTAAQGWKRTRYGGRS